MRRWCFPLAILMLLVPLPLLSGCQGDSSSGPDDTDPFPAHYIGTYRFNVLPIEWPMDFWIYGANSMDGTWTGTDSVGDTWTLQVTGSVAGGTIHLTIVGDYDQSSCPVTGEADGTSPDDYDSFSGTWSLTECHQLGFAGTWEATREGS